MSPEPLATIVVTPRERYSIARRMMETLIANTPEAHRLICVAGAAPQGVQEYLESVCARPGYELILRPDFLPCNVARNLGIARVGTEYVVFVENDVLVEPGWLGALLRCAEEEHADFVGPLCLEGEPEERNVHSLGGMLVFEDAGGRVIMGERQHLGPICLRTTPQSLARLPADYIELHCALVRKSVLDRIGPLDERVLTADEHLDLALHQRALGCRGFSEPAAVVTYLATDYRLGDFGTGTLRWSGDWYYPTMTHLAGKWALAPESPTLLDSMSSYHQIRERSLLRQELSAPPPATKAELTAANGPVQTIVGLLQQMENLGYPLVALERVRAAYTVAMELFASCFRASGRTFLAHLVGTGSIMAAFGANPPAIAAAVLHAAYGYGQFPEDSGKSPDSMRRWLKRRVGECTEALVYAYSQLHLNRVEPYFAGNLDGMPVRLAHVVMIRAANGIDDRIHGDHNYFDSANWLQASNAQIGTWMPAFTAVGDRLGMSGMVSILQETVAWARPDAEAHPLRPAVPMYYRIDLADQSRAAQPLAQRSLPQENPPVRAISASRSFPTAIQPSAIFSANGGQVECETNCARVVFDPRPWAYSAGVRLDELVNAKGPATIEVRLEVESGTMGVLVLESGSSSVSLVPEQSASEGEPAVLQFEIPAMEDAGQLIFRSWPSEPGPARARILAMNVFLEQSLAKQAAGG